MDGGGRVVIPKELRARLGLGPGQELEIAEVDGQILLERPSVPMRAERRGSTLVAVTDEPMPVLSSAGVREVLEQSRR
jgi:AbrB family looped-hinge helix DNA binding protein